MGTSGAKGQGHLVWQAPYRPLFLLASLSALGVPAVWLVPSGIGPDPIAWHLHELMFGMGGAAIGGYLLTALPNWTQQGPVAPRITMAMGLLWGLSRLSFAFADQIPFAPAAAGAEVYLVALMALLGWRIVALRIWSKAWFVLMLAALAASDLRYLAHLHAHRDAHAAALQIVLAFALLIALVGGRAVPAFTESWLARQAAPGLVRDRPALSALAVGALVCGGLLTIAERDDAAGAFLMLSGALLFVRMSGWQTWRSSRYPALLVLHLAWVWLPAGLLLVGLALTRPEWMAVPDALHALTMGAMGTMILAVMARSVMVRRGDVLVLGKRLALAFALVWLSALFRVLAPFLPSTLPDPMHAAAVIWMAGWALFLWVYVASLREPAPRPVLSARLRRL